MEKKLAIETLKSFVKNTDNVIAKDAILALHPELAESEDERIRKELWKYFHDLQLSSDRDFSPSFTIDDILAYLEKQKEQKPLSTEETELNSIAFLEQMGYTCIPPGKEQPAEWSEKEALNETKQECDSIDIPSSIKTSRIETLKNIISYFKYERKTTQEEIRTSFIHCLENLLKDVENTNSHTEWSEEEKARIERIVDVLDWAEVKGRISYSDWEDYICYVKSLKPQPKQECSDGEKKVLDSIIDDYEKAAKSFCGYEGKIMLLKAIRDGEYDLPKQECSEDESSESSKKNT